MKEDVIESVHLAQGKYGRRLYCDHVREQLTEEAFIKTTYRETVHLVLEQLTEGAFIKTTYRETETSTVFLINAVD